MNFMLATLCLANIHAATANGSCEVSLNVCPQGVLFCVSQREHSEHIHHPVIQVMMTSIWHPSRVRVAPL